MPAQAPLLNHGLTQALRAFGARLRERREALGISAVAAAEAAGMSRTTLHRVEAGEPSVTMGAYLGAAHALGLAFDLQASTAAVIPSMDAADEAPERVVLARYPLLHSLAWQRPGATELTAHEALALYERNWRHVDEAAMTPEERGLVQSLVKRVGRGRLLV